MHKTEGNIKEANKTESTHSFSESASSQRGLQNNVTPSKATLRSNLTYPAGFSAVMKQDKGVWSLLAANLITLLVALFEGWELHYLMTIYLAQSIMIGAGNFIRMLNLEQFDPSGFKMNGKPVKETPQAKKQVAIFFLIHFGFFHFGYGIFLIAQYNMQNLPWFSTILLSLVFAVQQWASVKDDIREDRDRRPNIGTMMFLPYARIVPMHLMIIIGGMFAGTMLGVLLFLLLKIAADLLMYVIELYALYPKQRKLPG
ncbi:DUF6498-containing protein [Neptuniibacter sp.]|uniref:DUF6498-containing protein n=1 Tax=Neptuniibacter sp. TaxID=1962643 RepID=UPI002620EFE8|nr:DUF6498-containing protein [Neptuniibacter sp.]MCP4596275.1 hypothetical protein [Neptuniibacter sp.]